MVRKYKRTTTRGSYGDDALKKAIDAVRAGMSLKRAASQFGVPRPTLRRHRDSKVQHPGTIQLGSLRPILNDDFEKELVAKIQMMEQAFFGLTTVDVRRLAFDMATRLRLKTNFSKDSRMAGADWLRGFLKRNPQLSIRIPQPTSINRAVGFNRPRVDAFFALYKSVITAKNYTATKIWNMDESGVTNVQKPHKVISTKGKRQVSKMTSGEKGATVTVLCCMNAAGQYIPPMIIFPRKRLAEGLMRGAPPGSIGAVSDNGWTDGDRFIDWLKHFIKTTKCTKDDPQVIIVDGHHSHKTLAAIDLARDSGITLLTLPSHCTHKLQPLDRTFFKSFKSNYNRAADNWMISNPGMRITAFNVSELIGSSYCKSATIDKAVKGFETCGLWPFNDTIFSDEDFSACDLTDEPLPQASLKSSVTEEHNVDIICRPNSEPSVATHTLMDENQLQTTQHPPEANDIHNGGDHVSNPAGHSLAVSSSSVLHESTPVQICIASEEIHQATTDSVAGNLPSTESANRVIALEQARVILEELSPKPKIRQPRSRTRKTESAAVITSSPYKLILENKALSSERKGKKRTCPKTPHVAKAINKQSRKRGQQIVGLSNDDKTPCSICSIQFDQPPFEDWLQCPKCTAWYHESCGPEDTAICYRCLS